MINTKTSSANFGDGALIVGDDRLRGVSKIAEFLGESRRRTYYLLEKALIPAGKEGEQWIASRQALREFHTRVTRGSA
jgi:hypothetical protein